MPKGPQGQKRPGDVIGAAIMVAKIATGEVEDNAERASPSAGPPTPTAERAESAARRTEMARHAAKSRWAKPES